MTRADFVFGGFDAGIYDLPAELLAARDTYRRLANHQIPPALARDGYTAAVDQLLDAARTGGELLVRVDESAAVADQEAANVASRALRDARDRAKAQLEVLAVDLRDGVISEHLAPVFVGTVQQARTIGPLVQNTGGTVLAAAKADSKTRSAIVELESLNRTYTVLRDTWGRLMALPPAPEFADRVPPFGEVRNVPQAWPGFSTRFNVQQLREWAP